MRVLIVDDEPILAETLRDIVRQCVGPRLTSVTVRHSIEASRCHLWEEAIDLLFLDLNLFGEDGFRLLHEATAGAFQTIVVSAHSDRAVEAFAYGVLDFIPKPASVARVRSALERFAGTRERRREDLKFLSSAREGAVELVPIAEILRLEADGKRSRAVRRDGSIASIARSLGELADALPAVFVRIHKSHIVNLDAVASLERSPGSRYHLTLRNGERLPVGRAFYPDLNSRLA